MTVNTRRFLSFKITLCFFFTIDLSPFKWNFDLDKSGQKFHHSLKEHHNILGIVIFRSFVAKCCKMRIIWPCEVFHFSVILHYKRKIDNQMIKLIINFPFVIQNREFKLCVIRQTTNARQRKKLRYQAIKSKWTCCFKTAMHDYSFDTRKKIWKKTFNENFAKKVRTCRLPLKGLQFCYWSLFCDLVFIELSPRRKRAWQGLNSKRA
jgi:hypothetical protein